jgi:8-oxo-dGTP pyrophosphatase MutT (NUDIX family)
MVASSILPVTIYKNQLYFLFGKENEMEDSAKGFSDFGGRVESGESIMETAYREGAEELCGFLGNPEQLKKQIKRNGGTYHLEHNDYHIHIFYMDYDERLPHYFTQNHRFLWNKMDRELLNASKCFEKQEIRWFSTDEMKSHAIQKQFRPFYVEMVELMLKNIDKIRTFILSKTKKWRKTKKMGKGG